MVLLYRVSKMTEELQPFFFFLKIFFETFCLIFCAFACALMHIVQICADFATEVHCGLGLLDRARWPSSYQCQDPDICLQVLVYPGVTRARPCLSTCGP